MVFGKESSWIAIAVEDSIRVFLRPPSTLYRLSVEWVAARMA